MFNLLVSGDGWADNGRDTMPLGRILEYTEDDLRERFSLPNGPDLGAMIVLPSLFLAETGGNRVTLRVVENINRACATL